MDAFAQYCIEGVIKNDEGGWKLTHNTDDPDGGWCYAGVTATKWAECYGACDFAQIELSKDTDATMDKIRQLYYEKFWMKLQIDMYPQCIQQPMLSAAVNIGCKGAVKVLQAALNSFHKQGNLVVDGKFGDKTLSVLKVVKSVTDDKGIPLPMGKAFRNVFLTEWMRFYINLVQANAEAWRAYAEQTNPMFGPLKKPETLRASQLEGWFNRIQRYRML